MLGPSTINAALICPDTAKLALGCPRALLRGERGKVSLDSATCGRARVHHHTCEIPFGARYAKLRNFVLAGMGGKNDRFTTPARSSATGRTMGCRWSLQDISLSTGTPGAAPIAQQVEQSGQVQ
uniref:Uncharacterized protein n=1 Tax=Anopheles melas TaxID=34690 RepID=A0A182TLA3_9DIPT